MRARFSRLAFLSFRARITRFEDERILVWHGGLPVPGLFLGEHVFLLREDPRGGSILRQNERYRGLLAPCLGPILARLSRRGFQRMDEALKKRAEDLAST
ncbi:MAG: hypothetical protein Kow00129_13650 [Thermoleophilia bacterium]